MTSAAVSIAEKYPLVLSSKLAGRLCWVWITCTPLVALFIRVRNNESNLNQIVFSLTNYKIDLKPGNVLLGLEKIEEMVQKHLNLYPCDDSSNSRAPHFESKAIANAKLDPSASIHIRIVDFGVGKWEADTSVPRQIC